jgi:hypothetical protein
LSVSAAYGDNKELALPRLALNTLIQPLMSDNLIKRPDPRLRLFEVNQSRQQLRQGQHPPQIPCRHAIKDHMDHLARINVAAAAQTEPRWLLTMDWCRRGIGVESVCSLRGVQAVC